MSNDDKQRHLNDQIRNLPYKIIQKLAQFLDDPDDNTMNWKALIAAMPDDTYTMHQVKQFDKAGMARGGSSTEALLQDMGHKCKTVKQLVAYLETMGHTEALQLLKPDEAAEIIEHPKSQVVQEGNKVVIVCKTIGFPPPQFLWLKDGAEFRHGCDNKLVFNSVKVKDSGKYTCIVSNPLSTEKSKVAELQVHGTPICTHPPTIVEHPLSTVIPVGQEYAIACRAREPCNYQWFKDGFELREERSPEIRFLPFNYQDEGNYTCRVFNSEGDALSRIATLQSYTDPSDEMRYTRPGRQRGSQELTQTADDKVALVFGNRDYINLPPGESPLVHTCSDARTLASILRKKSMGFKVISLINLTHSEMNKAIDIFCDLLGENVYGLLYFAGHGFEDRGQNYIVPIDAETDWTPDRAICVQEILLRMHARGTSFHLFLLDICRKMTNTKDAYQMKTYPFPHDAQVVYGFATSPGHEAYERKSDANGLYMKHLVQSIMTDEKVEEVLSRVASDIEEEVSNDEYVSRMRPQYYSKTARSYSLMDPVRENWMAQERSEKWLHIHRLPQKQVLEFQGIKLEIRFEHTNWLSNAILVCLRVLDLGDATMCDANLTHLPKDFQECHFHPSTTNILRHVVPPETVARTWKMNTPRESPATPVPVERFSEIYNIQRLKHNQQMSAENSRRGGRGDTDSSPLDNTDVVSHALEDADQEPNSVTSARELVDVTDEETLSSPLAQENEISCMSIIRNSLKSQGFSHAATSIILSSWRPSSKAQYDSYIKRWVLFSSQRQINPISPPVEQAIDFLTELYSQGLGYSAINTARSALSAIILPVNNVVFGEHPYVKRFLKGVFQTRPALPRYTKVWDVSLVLKFLSTLIPVNTLPFKELSHKLVMLVAIVTAQRGQTLQLLDIGSMVEEPTAYTFRLHEHVKQSRPGLKGQIVRLQAFPNKELCVFTTCKEYLARTQDLRGNKTRLILTVAKPHKPASRDTIRRWIRNVLQQSGIDVSVFKSHSTRAASTSKAKSSNVPMKEIMKTAGWKSDSTFAKHYDLPIVTNDSMFANKVLAVN